MVGMQRLGYNVRMFAKLAEAIALLILAAMLAVLIASFFV